MTKVPNLRLKYAREQRGWSQEDVANKIDAPDSSYISRWERGIVVPSPYYRQRLCELFGKSAEELGFTGEAYRDISSQEKQPAHSVDERHIENYEANTGTYQSIPGAATPPLRREKQHRFFYIVGLVIALTVVSIGVIVYVIHPFQPAHIKPGGAWISPKGQTVGKVIHFAAYAYPTNKDDPEIDHVNFTVYWQGVDPRKWIIACVARKPFNKDIFACDADLHALGAAPSQIQISFDVYDRQGNVNFAPNGEHTLTYSP